MLSFKPITIDTIDELLPFAQLAITRSCDYTPGNLVMWARYMNYCYAIENGTLFIQCKSQADMASDAFLPPIGKMPFEESLTRLVQHCESEGKALRLTAVPEEMLAGLTTLLPQHTATLLEGWSDYIYSAGSLATLKGKALNKKRNRYNKFIAEQPQHFYSRFSEADAAEVTRFLIKNHDCEKRSEGTMRCYEQWQCINMVKNIGRLKQTAAILRVDGEIAAFTLGEPFGDTLYVHIEKADHNIAGAGEAINRMFVSDILGKHPEVLFVNREEDLGDPGLRQAKRAYSPIMMLHRYEMSPLQV